MLRPFTVPLNIYRDLNIAYYLFAYFMPLLLLATPDRLGHAWRKLEDHRSILMLYLLFMSFLVMYGGTDIGRFMAYFYIPLIIILGTMLEDGIPLHEIAYMLVAVMVFNRLHLEIPNAPDSLIFFYGGHDDGGTMVSLKRFGELMAFWAGAIMLRFMYKRYSLKKARA